MKSNETEIKGFIEIEDLNHDEIQEFRKLSDEELSNIVGGLDAGEGGDGLACPFGGGILRELLCT